MSYINHIVVNDENTWTNSITPSACFLPLSSDNPHGQRKNCFVKSSTLTVLINDFVSCRSTVYKLSRYVIGIIVYFIHVYTKIYHNIIIIKVHFDKYKPFGQSISSASLGQLADLSH